MTTRKHAAGWVVAHRSHLGHPGCLRIAGFAQGRTSTRSAACTGSCNDGAGGGSGTSLRSTRPPGQTQSVPVRVRRHHHRAERHAGATAPARVARRLRPVTTPVVAAAVLMAAAVAVGILASIGTGSVRDCRQLCRLQEHDRHHQHHDQPCQRRGRQWTGRWTVRRGAAGDEGVRRLLQLPVPHLWPQARTHPAGQSDE